MSASMAARWSAGIDSTAASTLAQPLFGSPPAAAIASPCLANTSAKNTSTAWPNMIGSETFIIVAFRWSENSTPWSRASAICSARNVRSAATSMTVESTTSPASTGSESLSTVTVAVGGDVLDAKGGVVGQRDRLLVRRGSRGRSSWRRASSTRSTTRPSSAGATSRSP